ncbi:glycosyltransferase family 2 protein [Lentisphaerota bacterium ZTH]|nr:glycosyltransferase [Lentisphaerota bacterium]WET05490.1 glycosyltransferase family 2 protein [Lentisphaerota bacterium ZTH]
MNQVSKVKISVVTPVLNSEKYVKEIVESVLSQKGDFELEYIVKDGQSTDRTLEVLKDYENLIKVISCPDTSTEDAIYQGMEAATGDIVCWIGADDKYAPGTFQSVVDQFKAHPDRDWQYGRCRIIDDKGHEVRKWITLYKNIIGYFYCRRVLFCENYINQPAVFFKRSLWEKVKGRFLDYHFGSDYNLWINFSMHSKAIAVHRYYSSFRRHEDSTSHNSYIHQLEDSIEISKRYGNNFYALIFRLNKFKTVLIYRLLDKFK